MPEEGDFGATLAALAEKLGTRFPKLYARSETIRAAARALQRTSTEEWERIARGVDDYAAAYRTFPDAAKARTLNGANWFDGDHWDDDRALWVPRLDFPRSGTNGVPRLVPVDDATASAEMSIEP